MSQPDGEIPTPPGNAPLIEDLGSDWNGLVEYVPEDKRGEFSSKLKERVSSYEPLESWRDFTKSGVTPDQAGTALSVYNMIEQNPKNVYDQIGQYLKEQGMLPNEVNEVMDDLEEGQTSDDPRLAKMERTIELMAQTMLGERQQALQNAANAAEDRKLAKEIEAAEKKFGRNVPEDELLMLMHYKNVSAEKAYQMHLDKVSEYQKRRPSPMVMGGTGSIPQRQIDPTKMNSAETKNLVAQMLEYDAQTRNS